jgi:Domain of unknown function (DUF4465)/Secretion system C-terminal sorting domain
MKKQVCSIFAITVMVVANAFTVKAQTVSTFENLTLAPSSYWDWDGSSTASDTTFRSGHAIFPNIYDTAYGGYWAAGWAYSDMKDSTTRGYTNMFSSRSADGYNGSANYAIGTQDAIIELDSTGSGKVISGFYVNNGTYAALSMKNGDSFERKFGDTTGTSCHCVQGTYPDWFKLTIHKWFAGTMPADSVTFYLADYRFGIDTAADYIVSKWQWVDLTSLGNVDSLQYTLSSSENNSYGMLTPAYFCIDNFTTDNSALGVKNIEEGNLSFQPYPNPTTDIVNIDLSKVADNNMKLNITDITGQLIHTENVTSRSVISIDMSSCASGVYFINITGDNTFANKKLIKE